MKKSLVLCLTLILMYCTALSLLSLSPVIAQEAPQPTEPVEVVATAEATPVPAAPVTVNIDTGSEAPNGGYDGWLLLVIVGLVSGLLYALYRGNKYGDMIGELQKFVTLQTESTARNDELARQFQRLSPDKQDVIRQVLNVADPLTAFVPGNMDDRVVQWLKELTKQAAAQNPTLPGTP